jgi:hypothetical protein
MDDKALISEIRKGKRYATNQLYIKHLTGVKFHLVRKGCPMHLCLESYNDAFVAFHTSICDETFLEHNSLLPWLKLVAFRAYLKKINKTPPLSQPEINVPAIDVSMIAAEELKIQRTVIEKGMSKLGATCQQIIKLWLSDQNYSGADIAAMLQLASPGVVSTMKSRCLAKLKRCCQKS